MDINKTHELGSTGSLFWTYANTKRYDVAEYLISKGATTKMTEWYFNQNLLAYSLWQHHSKFSKLFIENGLFNIFESKNIGTYEDYALHSYFEAAVYYKDYVMTKYMMDKGVMNGGIDSETGKAVMRIAKHDNDDIMISLLKTGIISPNLQKWLDITEDETYKSVNFYNGSKLDFITTNIYGKTVNASSFEGKVVFLNFWATWCPYCIQEMPSMQSLQEIIGKDKMVIIVVSGEDQAMFDKIKNFARSKDYDFIFIHDPEGEIDSKYGASSLPGTRLFDTKGYSQITLQGSRTWDKDMYINLIKALYDK